MTEPFTARFLVQVDESDMYLGAVGYVDLEPYVERNTECVDVTGHRITGYLLDGEPNELTEHLRAQVADALLDYLHETFECCREFEPVTAGEDLAEAAREGFDGT